MRLKLWAAFAASTLVASTLISVPDARADKGDRFGGEGKGQGKGDRDKGDKPAKGDKDRDKKGDKKGDKADKGDREKSGKKIALAPAGLKFGLGLEAIAKIYDKVFDQDYLPLYKKASPGPETDALDAELKQRKGELRRSKVDFGDTPTGVDQTALKGEYSYANGESMGRMTLRNGTERYFFFFGDKLWKVYDELKLKKGGSLGESFDDAVKALGPKLGGAPKKVPAKPEEGRNFDEAQWVTSDMLIRALDRGNIVAVVWVDRDVQDKLPQLRRNKVKDQHGMDPDVAAALKKNEPPPDPKKDKEKEKKGKRDK